MYDILFAVKALEEAKELKQEFIRTFAEISIKQLYHYMKFVQITQNFLKVLEKGTISIMRS